MKKVNRIVCMLVVTGILGLTQCAYAAVTLSFWTEWPGVPYQPTIEKLIDNFQGDYPDIKIKHRPIEIESHFTVLRTGFTSGNPPDIFEHEGFNHLWQFVRPNQVLDITDWLTQHQERFNPGTTDSNEYEGKYWGIPWVVQTGTQIFYNGSILEKHGIEPPSTWKAFLESCQKFKDENITPIAFGNKYGWCGSQWFFPLLVRWVGSQKIWDLCARKPGFHWTDSDIVQAARFYEDLNNSGYFSKGKTSDDYPTAMALFFAGKSAFIQAGSWFIGDAVGMAPPGFDLRMLVFPQIDGQKGDPDEIVMQAIEGLAISRATKHPEAALKFFEFLSREENAEIWVKETQQMSAIRGAVNKKTAGKLVMEVVQEQLQDSTGSIPFLEHILPKAVGEHAIWTGSVGILTGELTAESWMQWVEEEAEKNEPVLE